MGEFDSDEDGLVCLIIPVKSILKLLGDKGFLPVRDDM